jgi:hypothetical protein
MCTSGFCRNLGDPAVSSVRHPGAGDRVTKGPGPGAGRPAPQGSEAPDVRLVPLSEGNEARREGRQGVGAPRSTAEAGEPTRGTPWREGGAGKRNRWRER